MYLMHAVRALALVALVVSCRFDRSGSADGDGQTSDAASDGASGAPDAERPIDASPPPDADPCVAACAGGTCVAGVCVVTCEPVDSCPERIVCPPGLPCRVDCIGRGSCGQ